MSHTAIEQTLSIKRFHISPSDHCEWYRLHCTSATTYEWNAELSSRFFFPLHIYEVAMRNAVSDAISIRYGEDWPTNTVFQNSLNDSDKVAQLSAISRGYQGIGKLLPEMKFV